jgi:peptide/nickel transport system ATP-binding protein
MQPTPPADPPLYRIEDLRVVFGGEEGEVRAVDGVTFDIPRGQTVCVVGESGSGKSMTGRAMMRLLPRGAALQAGVMQFNPAGATPIDMAGLDANGPAIRALRGRHISLISQEPMAALSPVHSIGQQMIPLIRRHLLMDASAARAHAIAMLEQVGIARASSRIDSYAFEFSGGMRQRVCIAMALACHPQLVIADEPTTALDVTTQANILDLLRDLQAKVGLSILFITHDLGVVAEMADKVVVMYLGRVVEQGDARQIFHDPRHPYTRALLRSLPKLGAARSARLETIRGMVPSNLERPSGCEFHPRCDHFLPGLCDTTTPTAEILSEGRMVRCLREGALS